MLCREPAAAMAKYLLHGTLHVTIYEGKNIVSERKSANAPAFFRKVSSIFYFVPTLQLLCRDQIPYCSRVSQMVGNNICSWDVVVSCFAVFVIHTLHLRVVVLWNMFIISAHDEVHFEFYTE